MTRPRFPRRSLLLGSIFLFAASPGLGAPGERPAAGKPTFRVDAIRFPAEPALPAPIQKQFKRSLERAGRNVDWGTGKESRIEARFRLVRLEYERTESALVVHATLVGLLPGGQTASSRLSFGGRPSERLALTQKVLEMLAQGVVARLAELERRRRGL